MSLPSIILNFFGKKNFVTVGKDEMSVKSVLKAMFIWDHTILYEHNFGSQSGHGNPKHYQKRYLPVSSTSKEKYRNASHCSWCNVQGMDRTCTVIIECSQSHATRHCHKESNLLKSIGQLSRKSKKWYCTQVSYSNNLLARQYVKTVTSKQ